MLVTSFEEKTAGKNFVCNAVFLLIYETAVTDDENDIKITDVCRAEMQRKDLRAIGAERYSMVHLLCDVWRRSATKNIISVS